MLAQVEALAAAAAVAERVNSDHLSKKAWRSRRAFFDNPYGLSFCVANPDLPSLSNVKSEMQRRYD